MRTREEARLEWMVFYRVLILLSTKVSLCIIRAHLVPELLDMDG